MPMRSGMLLTIDQEQARIVGQLTRDQRRARTAWLRGSVVAAAPLLVTRDEIQRGLGRTEEDGSDE
jgi:hypothetical protein